MNLPIPLFHARPHLSSLTRAALATLGALAAVSTSTAQILYVQVRGTGAQQVGQLRQINADGTGDAAVNTPFADVALPAWSRDGAQYAVTVIDPARPNQISRNVYAVTPGTGAIQPVTAFVDAVDPRTFAYNYVYGFYKAFSPDRSLVAVNSLYAAGNPTSSQTTTPTLQVFRADGQGGSQALVFMSVLRDGVHHAGEGVDWSPLGSALVLPVKNDAKQANAGGIGEATAIFLAEPVTGGGKSGQLTFPHADQTRNLATGEVTTFGEQDYQPKFSPDGNRVAYVRSFQNSSNLRLAPDADFQSLRITDGHPGGDVEVTRLQPGQYVTTLGWSPDGTQLVFDAGQQASSGGFYSQAAVPETNAVYIIGTDGAGLRQLAGNGAGQPAWKPLANGAGGPPAPGIPAVSAAASAASLSRGAGQTAIVTLTRTSDLSRKIAVAYTLGGTLVNGTDYALLPGTKKIKAGKSTAVVQIVPLPGGTDGKVVFKLAPGSGYTVGNSAKIKVKITE